MPSFRDDAVVLRTRDLGEADRIVTALTKSQGKIRAVAKGVRKTSSHFGARVEPFMVVDLQWAKGRTLDIIQQVELLGAYGAELAGDWERFTAASSIVETADRLTDHDVPSSHYALLVAALRSLSRGEHSSDLTLGSYLLRALAQSGWAPSVGACAQTGEPGPHRYFVAALGGVVSSSVAPPGSPTMREGVAELLEALLHGAWDVAEASTTPQREQALALIQAFTQTQLERSVRSFRQVGSDQKLRPTGAAR